MHQSYPRVLHANGFAKTMLEWLFEMENECRISKSQAKYLIPEELFSQSQNYAFRKFIDYKPWEKVKSQEEL